MLHFLRWCLFLDSATTQTTVAERAAMAQHVVGRKRIVEIGVWEGVTTRQLRMAMDSDAVYFAVDPYAVGRLGFSTQRVIARRTVNPVRNGAVIWIRDTGVGAAEHPETCKQPIDFIFVDGDHSYDGLKGDWNAWSDRLAPMGIIALHDSRATETRPIHDAGSVRFTQEVIKKDRRFEVIQEIDSLTILRRKWVRSGDCARRLMDSLGELGI